MPASLPHHVRTKPRRIGSSSQRGDRAAFIAQARAAGVHLGALQAAALKPSVPATRSTPPVFVERSSKSPVIVPSVRSWSPRYYDVLCRLVTPYPAPVSAGEYVCVHSVFSGRCPTVPVCRGGGSATSSVGASSSPSAAGSSASLAPEVRHARFPGSTLRRPRA